jgi:K+-transporting ATPase KdpF subunit
VDFSDDRFFRGFDRLRAFLRSHEVGEENMSLEAIIMLVISALTTVYLFYALLRPEKF